MPDDVWSIMQAARPRPMIDMGTVEPGSIRPTRTSEQMVTAPDGTQRRVDELQTVPGTAAYRSKMPPPPCFKCGEDHQPNRRYDHPWMQEPHVISADPRVHDMVDRIRQEGAIEHGNQPYVNAEEVREVPSAPSRRVAVYVGRNDMYVVAVEEAPDWDSIDNFKVPADQVLPIVRVARSIGIKVQDKTGGDLAALELDAGKS